MAKQLKKIYITDIAKMTQAMVERASKKHKSIIAYCIFIEGDHWHALTPEYESEREEKLPRKGSQKSKVKTTR